MLATQTDEDDVYVVSIRTATLVNGDLSKEGLFAEPVPFLQPIAFDLRSERLEPPLPFDPS
jgi:hypothetical protein